jgi:hypothetical protein
MVRSDIPLGRLHQKPMVFDDYPLLLLVMSKLNPPKQPFIIYFIWIFMTMTPTYHEVIA